MRENQITQRTANLMMDCALLAIGKIVGADCLITRRDEIEKLVRESFEGICCDNGITEVTTSPSNYSKVGR